ncbi:urease accessory protein UreF [Roseibium sp.]|uniref:urease accessory protein UreF n=1 Tax=Roseibium sp. TaxID=1936156 RepID=UPI003B522BB4
MTTSMSQSALYRLLTFLSPAFPIGAFTYSHGLEQVIDAGGVTSSAELQAWVEDVLKFGAGRSDAILMSETYRAAQAGDGAKVRELAELGLALQPSKERHLETSAQGTAFMETVLASWLPVTESPAAGVFAELTDPETGTALKDWPYPVALGLVSAAHDLPEAAALSAFLHAFSANLISVAVRAVPLGQNDGQRVLAALEPVIFQVTEEALEAGLDDLGTSTFLADIASMAHETQYSRLFRS